MRPFIQQFIRILSFTISIFCTDDVIYLIFFCRCTRPKWCSSHRTNAREVSVCSRRILSYSVSQSANPIWQASFATSLIENSVIASDWATLFCSIGWQNSYRNSHQRYDHVWSFLPVAFSLISREHLICDLSGCSSTPTSNICTYVEIFYSKKVRKLFTHRHNKLFREDSNLEVKIKSSIIDSNLASRFISSQMTEWSAFFYTFLLYSLGDQYFCSIRKDSYRYNNVYNVIGYYWRASQY